MKTIMVILILLAFLQSSVMPIDLVLIILLARSYIRAGKENLYLAFFVGLILSHLNLTPMGIQSILNLAFVQITQMLSKSRLAGNSLIIIPLSFVALLINEVINSLLLNQTLQIFPKVAVESILALPILYIIRFWEERFIARKDIKLKL